jgi:hypothetical protein
MSGADMVVADKSDADISDADMVVEDMSDVGVLGGFPGREGEADAGS